MDRELLIEIGCEEIPASWLPDLTSQLARKLEARLKEFRLEAQDPPESFSTPRRLTVRVAKLADRQEDSEELLTGPPVSAAFTAMAGVHLLIGIGEGLISALVLAAIQRTRPEMIAEPGFAGAPTRTGELLKYGLLVTLGLAVFVAPLACPWPDGLESVAAKLGFEHRAGNPLLPAPAADYQAPGVKWAAGATAMAGAGGALIVFTFAWLLGRWLVPQRSTVATTSSEARG